MPLPRRALLDPSLDQLNLRLRDRLAGIRPRHAEFVIVGCDPQINLTVIQFAGNDWINIVDLAEQSFFSVEPKVRLSRALVGTVAGIATVGEYGPDISVEVDWARRGIGQRAGNINAQRDEEISSDQAAAGHAT